jgi:hypothetical protein
MSDATNAVPLPPPPVELAFKRWLEHDRPPLRELARVLAEEGYQTSAATLSRMKDRHAVWLAAFTEQPDPGANRLQVTLRMLAKNAKDVDASVYEGLGARLVGKVVAILDAMEANRPEDLHLMLDAIDRVKGFAHDARGAQIERDARAANGAHGANGSSNGSGGILSQFTPKVAVPAFNGKKAG